MQAGYGKHAGDAPHKEHQAIYTVHQNRELKTEPYTKAANSIMGEVAGFGKGLSSTTLQFFPDSGRHHRWVSSIKLLFSTEFLLLTASPLPYICFLMGCFFTPFQNVDTQLQECKRANFCSILGWLYWKIILQFRKEFCWVVLISTDTSRSSVKLTELPVAVGKLREECTTSDHSSTINSQLGWHPL